MRNIVSPLDGFGSPFGRRGLSAYAIGNFDPALVADFDDEYYRANRSKTTFGGLLTHSRLSNATMVDSDGLIKWGPHNLLAYSEDIPTGFSTAQGVVLIEEGLPSPVGDVACRYRNSATSDFHRLFRSSTGLTVGAEYEFNVFAKPDTSDWIYLLVYNGATQNLYGNFNLSTGQVSGTAGVRIEPLDDGWYLCIVPFIMEATGGNLQIAFIEDFNTGSNPPTFVGTEKGCYIAGPHFYRSDLGGMVNNPDRGDSYVPTTSSAVYLPRRGHHVYNGSAWVNEGLLIETESRTNLLHTTNALVTQTLTVTAVPHTLHFTGTGTVTLSGASTDGPLVGTGTGEQNRVSLTFTPTAGLLMLIVTGTVADAQLEVGSTPSSYIPNLAASGTVNRTPDILTIPSAKLPWPSPKVIGPELVTNGTFDTDVSGWIPVADTGQIVTWQNGGYARFDRNSGNSTFQSTTSVPEAGKVYLVSVDVLDNTFTGTLTIAIGGASFLVGTNVSAGTYSRAIVTTSTAPLTVVLGAAAVGYYDLDNISVREIDPLAVSIQMDGRATGDTYTTTRWYLGANNYITQEINSSDFTFEQAASGTVDAVTGGSFTSGVNTSFNFASTHASTLVAAAVGGTALTDNTTPVALADLSSTDLQLGYSFMGTLKLMRMWSANITEAGREEAST